jgi:P-type Cu2+ transporter
MSSSSSPGERIAVDGEVISGWSECDESIVSGQPEPQPKTPGDAVHAGSLNGSGRLRVRASVFGNQTRWIRISRLVREALGRKSLLGETVDRVAGYFLPLVLTLAVGTFLFWANRSGLDAALLASLSVLVVACPCALGLAGPLATSLGIGRAAQRGVLIRGAGVLERLGRLRGIAFDKTGTLTLGKPQVMALRVHDCDETRLLSVAQLTVARLQAPGGSRRRDARRGARDPGRRGGRDTRPPGRRGRSDGWARSRPRSARAP